MAETITVASGPIDACGPVVDRQPPVDPQLNAARRGIAGATNLETAGEFSPLIGRIVGAGRIQRSGIIGLRVETGTGASLARGLRKSATHDVLDAVVVQTLLPIHLGNTPLEAVNHGGFHTAGTSSVWRVPIPDGLFPAAALA